MIVDRDKLRSIAAQTRAGMQASSRMRTVNADWGEHVPTLRFSRDQTDRALMPICRLKIAKLE